MFWFPSCFARVPLGPPAKSWVPSCIARVSLGFLPWVLARFPCVLTGFAWFFFERFRFRSCFETVSCSSGYRFGFPSCFARVALEFFRKVWVSLVFCRVSFGSFHIGSRFCCPPAGQSQRNHCDVVCGGEKQKAASQKCHDSADQFSAFRII